MILGIVVTHGNLGAELLETARMVFGVFSDFYAISNYSKTHRSLLEEMEKILSTSGSSGCVIFVDFFGGSCSYPCLKLQQTQRNICIISGVNLPMLLAFLNKRDKVTFEELPAELIKRGQNSIRMVELEGL